MDQADFLRFVFGSDSGRFQIRRPLGGADEWVEYPLSAPLTDDLYFRPVFLDDRGDEVVLAVGADVDDPVQPLGYEPSVTVVTSPGRHQAWWRLSEPVNAETEAGLRRALAPWAGSSDWFRIPGTVSKKRTEPFTIRVVSVGRNYQNAVLYKLPPAADNIDDQPSGEVHFDSSPEQLWTEYRDLVKSVYEDYGRPEALFSSIVDALIKAHLPLVEVLYISRGAASYPFHTQNYSGDRDLLKLIAVRRTALDQLGPALELRALRLGKEHTTDRKRNVAAKTIAFMQESGRFFHTLDQRAFYVEAGSGKAMQLSERSEMFRGLLCRRYGLNATESEAKFVIEEVVTHAKGLPMSTEMAEFSWFDGPSQTMYLHFGGRDVLTIRADEIGHSINGDSNILFQTIPLSESIPLSLLDPAQGDGWWDEFLPGMPNIEGMDEEEARAILHIWTIFVSFGNLAEVRPLLTFLGQPGSGKSMLSHRLYRLFYGPKLPLHRITTQESFDTASSNYPLVIYDNVDGTESWLPVKLAQSVSPTMAVKRRLYSDNDPFGVNNDAIIGLSSQNPLFSRADVNDRMLLFNLRRFRDDEFRPEWEIMATASARRERFISGLVGDIQKVLRTPRPAGSEGVYHRVQDFAHLGLWISRAVDKEAPYRSGMAKLADSQLRLTLEGDEELIDAIRQFVELASKREQEMWRTTGELLQTLSTYSRSPERFLGQYKSPTVLSNKLRSTAHAIAHAINIERRDGKKWSEWRIWAK